MNVELNVVAVVPVEELETISLELLEELHEFDVPVGFDDTLVDDELEESEFPGVVCVEPVELLELLVFVEPEVRVASE
ncbi:hypothetical protein OfM1_12670 [Lactovum odontotermitis]